MRKLKLFLIMLCLAVAVLPNPVKAAIQTESEDPELTIYSQADQEKLVGIEFEVYQIAQRSSAGEFLATDRFAVFQEALNDISDPRQLALKLEYFLISRNLQPDGTCTSDQNGIAKFPQSGKTLEQGLYLVIGKRHVQNGYIYEMDPMLVNFPHYDENSREWVNQYQIKPKFEWTQMPENCKIIRKVLKIWQDKGYEEQRPTRIKVMLLKDRKIYDTVILSKDNNWSYTWKDLDADAEWMIVEEDMAKYETIVTLKGITFVLTNVYIGPPEIPPYNPPDWPTDGPPDKPSDGPPDWPADGPPDKPTDKPGKPSSPPKLPQTGQLWWPVPVLLLSGLIAVAAGIARRREDYYEN